MIDSYKMQLQVFYALLKSDLLILRYNILDKLINLCIYVSVIVCVSQYLLPALGLPDSYGIFMFAGSLAMAGLFEVFPGAMALVNDFENEKTILYQLSLPIKSWLVILRLGIYYGINSFFLMLCMLPLGQLLLINKFNFLQVNLFKLLVIIYFASLFYGIFTLWFASKVKNSYVIGNIWMRFVFPMFQLGGLQFSWKVLHSRYPYFAYLDLLNPVIYITESFRSVILGQEEYISFWLCIFTINCFSLLFGIFAFKALKKRLDYI